MALCMTGSDLNSSSKPWNVQYRTAEIVYAEFHEQVGGHKLWSRFKRLQGDVEKALGWKPIPLFDRNNYPELASMQVRCSSSYFHRLCCNAHRSGSLAGSASRATSCWPR